MISVELTGEDEVTWHFDDDIDLSPGTEPAFEVRGPSGWQSPADWLEHGIDDAHVVAFYLGLDELLGWRITATPTLATPRNSEWLIPQSG